MKSKFHLITSLILIMAITGCTNSTNDEITTDNAPNTKAEVAVKEVSTQVDEVKEDPIEVDKGLFNVTVTLPASMFEGENIDDVIAKAKQDGVGDATKNDDGSLTYKMSKSVHNKLMKEMEDGVLEYVKEVKESGDYVSIKDVEYNKSFSEFTLVVDKESFEGGFDGFVTIGFGMMGMYYQLFDGVDPNNYKVTISIKDTVSGEIISSVIYPDALNE